VDADRSDIDGRNGQTRAHRSGVVGLVFVDLLVDAAAAFDDGAPSSLRAATDLSCDPAIRLCRARSSPGSQGIEFSLFEVQSMPVRDVVLVDGLADPRGVAFDPTTGCVRVVYIMCI
jgi:hypothetical protein